MSGMITIENLTKRHLQYRLEHQVVCVKTGKCFCKPGRRGTVTQSVHVPGGVGNKTEPLHPAVTMLPKVQEDAAGPKPRIKIHGSKPPVEEVEPPTQEDEENDESEGNTPPEESTPPGEEEPGKKEQAKSTKPKTRGGRGGRQGKKK